MGDWATIRRLCDKTFLLSDAHKYFSLTSRIWSEPT
jgi:hypothetical protein